MVQMDGDPYIKHSLLTSMFFPQTRLFVAGNPKAAGTALRWWLLAAHGVDVTERTAQSSWSESAAFQTVWDPRIDLTYTWGFLSDQQREDALTATDVLTVQPVRHPISRIFSTWSGKYLTGEPYYTERLPSDFPNMPHTVDDESHIAELFEKFVEALYTAVTENDFQAADVHFWPQHGLLGRDPAGSALVLRQETMSEGLATIEEHLRANGLDAGKAPHINETVVPYRNELVSDRAVELATVLYDGDFDRWQYSRERPPSSSRAVDIDWLNDVRGRNRRYGVIHRALRHQQRELSRLRDENGRLREREQELVDSTSWKVTTPLRWVSDNVKR
ncbi:MAG: sulfotransferase family 2 domain-containing protein [Actinomycetes bacterium]